MPHETPDTAAPRFPGGGHRTLADAVATALQWAAHLPPGSVVGSVGFGGGPTQPSGLSDNPPYWWSGAARLDIPGGLSSGHKQGMGPEEAARYNVRLIINSAVVYAQAEEKAGRGE